MVARCQEWVGHGIGTNRAGFLAAADPLYVEFNVAQLGLIDVESRDPVCLRRDISSAPGFFFLVLGLQDVFMDALD